MCLNKILKIIEHHEKAELEISFPAKEGLG